MRKLYLILALLLIAIPVLAQHSAVLSWIQPSQPSGSSLSNVTVQRNNSTIVTLAPSVLTYTDTSVTAGTTYTYTITNIANTGSAVSSPVTATIPGGVTPPPSAGISIFPSTAVPANTAGNDTTSVELGMKFTSTVAGTITAVRFYKATNSTGTHTYHIWSSTGASLASGTFASSTASGWQQQALPIALSIAANTTYMVSYHTIQYAYTNPYTWPVSDSTNTLKSASTADLYTYSTSSSLPASTYQTSNYWVDVVFVPGSVTPPPPTPSMTTVCSFTSSTVWVCTSTLANVPAGQTIQNVTTTGTLSNTTNGTIPATASLIKKSTRTLKAPTKPKASIK